MSSIDWLGKVNPSWGYAPLFTLGDPKKKPNKGMLESNLLSLSYGRIIRRDIESSDGLVPASYETYQIVEPGDTVLRFTDLQNDQRSLRSGLVEERGIITSAYLSFTPDRRRLNPAFFAHMMRAVDLSKVFYRMGSGVRQSLNWSEFSLMRLPLPPLETQQRIADYLDRETAEIDAAVADLDKYLELLEKRRLETITSAVEGSSGPGKDKLGSEEFFKPKLGYVVIDIRTGLNPRKNFELDTPGAENWYVTVRELDGVSIRTSEATSKINDQALEMIQKRARIKVGDVLFSGTGTIGNTALVSLPPSNWGVKEGIYILTPDISLMRSDFLLWILRSRKILSLADEMSDGSTIKSIPIEKLKRVPIPLPSLSVQKLIVNYLDRENTEIDALVTESKKLRGLLLKRRSVLITEVVTGRKQV